MNEKQRTAAKQALEALECVHQEMCDYMRRNNLGDPLCEYAARIALPAITALAQLAEPEPEPVAWMIYTQDGQSAFVTDNPTDIVDDQRALPIYTAPPARQPLTDKEMRHLWSLYGYKCALCMRFARAVERAHGIEEAK
jgi:hypothetical protein